MSGFGGYYKGEKKKPKKGKEGKGVPGSAPQFVMPELIRKEKKNNW